MRMIMCMTIWGGLSYFDSETCNDEVRIGWVAADELLRTAMGVSKV
jgi:hypothetical protein